MADDDQFQQGSGNWWDSATRNVVRFESGASQSSSSGGITNFAWQTPEDHMAADMKPTRSSMDSFSAAAPGSSSVVFHDTQNQKQLQQADSSTNSSDPNLHMMGLGLSSQVMDWNNQASLLRGGEKAATENSFRSMLQESSRTNFQQETVMGLSQTQVQWTRGAENDHEFKQVNNINRGFSLDQNQFSPPQYNSSGDSHSTVTSTFQVDSSSLYGTTPSILIQGLLGGGPDHHHNNQQPHQPMSFPYPNNSYGSLNSNNDHLMPSWSNKVPPHFLRASPPKQLPPNNINNQLHFTNNAPFWNASEAATNSIKDVRSSFFPSPFSTPNFDVQSKNVSEVCRDSGGGVVKKSGSEAGAAAPKRPRNETPSPLPAFKVRKEKMGDRITALQQLVSPFGKTDTASVLSEAIEYIKFLHEQVTVLSAPYIKSGAPIQIQQSSGKSKEAGEGPKQDLRSRGLCLVPVSSTFPVTHETTVDFWTPTFGGTSR